MVAAGGAAPLESLWLQLTLLLAFAVAGHFAVRRLGQPLVVGQLLLGMILGPSVLGLITDARAIEIFAQLGAVLLLFLVGLECDFREIYTSKSVAIAAGGVILPWVGGYSIAVAWGMAGPRAIFIGAVLVATSVGITAAVLLELGKLGTRAAKAILGAAVVDDVLGIVALAIASGVAKGGVSADRVLLLFALAGAFIAVGVVVGTRYASRLVDSAERWGTARDIPHQGFILGLGFAFLYAFVAELLGLAAIIGAFVAGTAFARVPIRERLHRGTSTLTILFVPIFFVSTGILVDLRGAASLIEFGLLLTAIAVVTKLAGCFVPARLFGHTGRESLFIGVGMVPRGEVGLIVAVAGLSAGFIDSALYSAAVLAVFLTTLVAPPLLRALAGSLREEGPSASG